MTARQRLPIHGTNDLSIPLLTNRGYDGVACERDGNRIATGTAEPQIDSA